MSAGLAHRTYDHGGMCYAGCMEAFEWYLHFLFTITGGTHPFSGARRAVISERAACLTPFLGKHYSARDS